MGSLATERYCWARYYHTDLQRFVSEDPLEFSSGDSNLFSYVLNSPLQYVDPLGLEWQLTIGVTALAGWSPFLISSPYVGGGTSLVFTSSGQIGLQFTATGEVGAGFFFGVAGQVGLGHTRCPTKGGLTTTRVVQAEANFGTGPGAVGASVQVDPNNGVAVQRTGRIGVGGGAMVAAGVSQVVTIASPPILGGGRSCGCP